MAGNILPGSSDQVEQTSWGRFFFKEFLQHRNIINIRENGMGCYFVLLKTIFKQKQQQQLCVTWSVMFTSITLSFTVFATRSTPLYGVCLYFSSLHFIFTYPFTPFLLAFLFASSCRSIADFFVLAYDFFIAGCTYIF